MIDLITWKKLEDAYFDYTYFICFPQEVSQFRAEFGTQLHASNSKIRITWLNKLRQFKLSERTFLREFDRRYPTENGRATTNNVIIK
jgi:hypothetical protein